VKTAVEFVAFGAVVVAWEVAEVVFGAVVAAQTVFELAEAVFEVAERTAFEVVGAFD